MENATVKGVPKAAVTTVDSAVEEQTAQKARPVCERRLCVVLARWMRNGVGQSLRAYTRTKLVGTSPACAETAYIACIIDSLPPERRCRLCILCRRHRRLRAAHQRVRLAWRQKQTLGCCAHSHQEGRQPADEIQAEQRSARNGNGLLFFRTAKRNFSKASGEGVH